MEDEIVRKPIPREKYDLLSWTKYEKLFRNRVKFRRKVLTEVAVPFTIALQVKLRRSLFGTYLKYFNENQWQNEFLNTNKISITDSIIQGFDKKKQNLFEYNNNLFDEIIRYLKNTSTETNEIDCGYLYGHATHLRLDDYYINSVDDGLRNFKNLQVLVICGNWINDLDGAFLPRRLKFLEMYANDITTLSNFVEKAPRNLVHLGLGRNKLTNDSGLHLLVESGRFSHLITLDISECDICNLIDVLHELEELPRLESLQLQGNPCSTVTGYKDIVLERLPYLIFLDEIEISKSDRKLAENFLNEANNAELFFTCVKISGLQKPPKGEKKIKQSIHMEITMPLFQEDVRNRLTDSELAEIVGDESNTKKSKHEKGKKHKHEKKKKKGKEKKSKGGKGVNIYNKEDEYNPRIKNNSFHTDRKQWSKVMNYATINLKSPENNLETYRDSFRSAVNVDIVYLKVQPPEKKKKGKKGKKDKHKKKKEKSTKSSKKSKKTKSKKTHSETTTTIESKTTDTSVKTDEKVEKKPMEKILKRITVANFTCDLSSVDWKSSYIDFYWSEDPQFGNKAIDYKIYLEELAKKEEEKKQAKLLEKQKAKEKQHSKKDKKGKKEKKDKKSKKSKEAKKKSKSSKGSSKSKKSKSSKKSKKSKSSKKSKKSKEKSDKYMTCLVRFGLSRIGIVHSEVKDSTVHKGKKGKKDKKDKKRKG